MAETKRTLDAVDYTLAVGFLVTLATVCAMAYSGAEIPPVLENIMWALAFGFGAKKIPTKL